jgi:hypothetical protein
MNIIEATAEATNINKQIKRPNDGKPRTNPSRMVKKSAIAMILLNLKDLSSGVRKPMLHITPSAIRGRIGCGPTWSVKVIAIRINGR